MRTKKIISLTINPEIEFYLKQLAERDHRPVSNFIEKMVIDFMEIAKSEGFSFKPYPFRTEHAIIGKSGDKDEILQKKHDDFLKQ
jgi:hypothetical protein